MATKTKKRLGLNKAAEKIATIIEKRLATLPASARDAKLAEIHRIASNAGHIPPEKSSAQPRIQAFPLHTRPHEES